MWFWERDDDTLYKLSDLSGLATHRRSRSLLQEPEPVVIAGLCVDSLRVWAVTDKGALWEMPTRGQGANTWSLVFGSGTVKKCALDTQDQLYLMNWESTTIWKFAKDKAIPDLEE